MAGGWVGCKVKLVREEKWGDLSYWLGWVCVLSLCVSVCVCLCGCMGAGLWCAGMG